MCHTLFTPMFSLVQPGLTKWKGAIKEWEIKF